MPPIVLLAALSLITAAGAIVHRLLLRREQRAYREIALTHRLHYSPRDPLRLTPRVAAHMPVPGAAAVRVFDLLYRTDDQSHYYIFTVEYTIGVVGPKRRVRRAATFTESKSTTTAANIVRLASMDLGLIEQYRSLIELIAIGS